MKKIKQIRFYEEASTENYPEGLTINSLVTGAAFKDYYPITQLGIQALPGTKFYINGSNYPVVVGFTGIYELDSSIIYQINQLSFSQYSLDLIKQNGNAYLMVDIVYGE